MVDKLGKYAVICVGGFVVLLLASMVLGWWMIPLGLIAAVGLVAWVSNTLLPTWREKHEWYKAKGAVSRALHGVATFFGSLWFAGAILAAAAKTGSECREDALHRLTLPGLQSSLSDAV